MLDIIEGIDIYIYISNYFLSIVKEKQSERNRVKNTENSAISSWNAANETQRESNGKIGIRILTLSIFLLLFSILFFYVSFTALWRWRWFRYFYSISILFQLFPLLIYTLLARDHQRKRCQLNVLLLFFSLSNLSMYLNLLI